MKFQKKDCSPGSDSVCRKNNKTGNCVAGLGFFALSLVVLIQLFTVSGKDIWYDEFFSEALVRLPLGKMMEIAAQDVHPPLYYLLLKGLTSVFACFGLDLVTAGKVSSVLPYALTVLLGMTWFRRRAGMLSAGIFSFCIVGMPQMAAYALEIRMYGWGMFLVTAQFLAAAEIAAGRRRTEEGMEAAEKQGVRFYAWPCFWLAGICAAYTHYYAAVAAAAIYLIILVFLLAEKDRKRLGYWGICAGLSIAAYLPWVLHLFSQVAAVSQNYWILPLTASVFGGCVKFLCKPLLGFDWLILHVPGLDTALAVLLFLAYALSVLFLLLRREGKKKISLFFLSGLVVLGLTALFGIVASFVLRPVFVYRYLLPAAGCFWLAFSWCLGQLGQNSRKTGEQLFVWGAAALLLAVGICNCKGTIGEEKWKRIQLEQTMAVMEQVGENDALLFNFDQLQSVASWYFPQDSYLWGGKQEALVLEMNPGLRDGIEDLEEIWAQNYDSVWYLGTGEIQERIVEDWREQGIEAEEKAVCLIERYWFHLYRLHRR